MTEELFDLDQIADETGLKKRYLRDIIRKSVEFKNQYSRRGPNNSLRFNSNGRAIFFEVVKLKESGKTSSEISTYLEGHLQDSSRKTISKPRESERKTSGKPAIETTLNQTSFHQESFMEKYFDKYDAVSQKYEQTLITLSEEKVKRVRAEEAVRLLTDGRDPQIVKEEQYKRLQKQARMEISLEDTQKALKEAEQQKENVLKERKLQLTQKEALEEKLDTQTSQIADLTNKQEKFEKQRLNEKTLRKELQEKLLLEQEIKSLWEKYAALGFFQGREKKAVLAKIKELSKTAPGE